MNRADPAGQPYTGTAVLVRVGNSRNLSSPAGIVKFPENSGVEQPGTCKRLISGMKRLALLAGLSLLVASVARGGVGVVGTAGPSLPGAGLGLGGVGPGVASELAPTRPLRQSSVSHPQLTLPPLTTAARPVKIPAPVPPPVPAHIVPPLPNPSAPAPVAVTVGPTVHPSTIQREHGIRGWFHRHF